MSENAQLDSMVQAEFKKPRVQPTLVCGACGYELFPRRDPLRLTEMVMACQTPRCGQRGRLVLVPLRERIDVKVLD